MGYRSWLLLVGASLACLRCGMGKDVSETKKTSADIKTISQEIATGTSKIIKFGRKGQVNEDLPIFWNDLMNSSTNPDRLHYATLLCSVFEFQQWTGTYGDTLELKNRLDSEAVRAFVAFIKAKIARNYEIGGLMPVGQRWLALAAVGAVMSEIDADQADALKAYGVQPRSIYSMIIDGLGYKDADARGEKIPDFAREVLKGEKEVVFLLQLRQNFLPIMVLSEFTDLDRVIMTLTNIPDIPSDWYGYLKGLGFGFTANIGDENFTKITGEGLLWISQALQTQRDLRKLGYPVVANRFLARLFIRSEFNFSGMTDQKGDVVSQIQLLSYGVDAIKQSYVDNVHRYWYEDYIPQAIKNW
jgi:hypothetical protein